MSHTSATIGRVQLDDFVSIIPRIYQSKDRYRSLWDVWLHTLHHASAIGEEVRKGGRDEKLFVEIADFSMWFFTVLSKMNGETGVRKPGEKSVVESLIRVRNSYSDLLWLKYPQMCPVCYWRRTHGDRDGESQPGFDSKCDCLLHEVEKRDQSQKEQHVRNMRSYARKMISRKPAGVDQWQEMFATIFEANLKHIDLPSAAFHLLEEVGEVSDAMARMYTYRTDEYRPGSPSWAQVWLEEELADVGSWLFAIVTKADSIRMAADAYERWQGGDSVPPRPQVRLSNIIWRRYGLDELQDFYCVHCRQQSECACPIVLIPGTHTVKDLKSKMTEVI